MAALTSLLLACGDAEQAIVAPVESHGAVVMEPSTILVGELVTIDLTVVTPPGHRVAPIEIGDVPPLWLLDAEHRAVERRGDRWLHVTRIRARVREVPGQYEWPEQRVTVEDESGATKTVLLEARPFVVAAASDRAPERLTPFGLRTPPEGAAPGGLGLLGAAALGSIATFGLLAGLRILRRRRRSRGPGETAADRTPAWARAESELRALQERIDADPRGAADGAALALRRYVSIRSARSLETSTTEELAARRPPGRLRSLWPTWIDLLRRLDALRFPGHLANDAQREELRTWFDEALDFVARSVPPREMR